MNTAVPDHVETATREWVNHALLQLQREAARSADTHLLRIDLPHSPTLLSISRPNRRTRRAA